MTWDTMGRDNFRACYRELIAGISDLLENDVPDVVGRMGENNRSVTAISAAEETDRWFKKNIPSLGAISGMAREKWVWGAKNETQTGTWIFALAVTLNYFPGSE